MPIPGSFCLDFSELSRVAIIIQSLRDSLRKDLRFDRLLAQLARYE